MPTDSYVHTVARAPTHGPFPEVLAQRSGATASAEPPRMVVNESARARWLLSSRRLLWLGRFPHCPRRGCTFFAPGPAQNPATVRAPLFSARTRCASAAHERRCARCITLEFQPAKNLTTIEFSSGKVRHIFAVGEVSHYLADLKAQDPTGLPSSHNPRDTCRLRG